MTDHQQIREALEASLVWRASTLHKFHRPVVEKALEALSRLEAAAAAEYERGRQDGIDQERALWKLAHAGQEIEAAAVPELSREVLVAEAERLLDAFIEADPERAERFIESQLARLALKQRLAEKQAASLVRSNCPEIPDGSPAAPQPGDKMTQDEIISMANEAHGPITGQWWDLDIAALKRFAALVAAAEREACAKVCENYHATWQVKQSELAAAIRARSTP